MKKLFEHNVHKYKGISAMPGRRIFPAWRLEGILLMAAVVCGACRQGVMEPVVAEEGLPAVIQLNVQAEEQPDMLTRATAVNSNVIDDLHVLVYDGNGELIGQKYQPTGGTITVKTHKASSCTIYAIANTGDANFFKGYDKHLKKSLTDRICTLTSSNELDGRKNIPMTGMKANVNIVAGSQSLGNLEVTRMAAKVTLNIGAATHSGITVKDYTVYSLPLKSYYIPRPLSTENKKVDTDTAPGDDASKATDNTHWADGPLTAVNAASVSTTFYMFENRRGVVKSINLQKDKIAAKAPAHATYVEINGTAGNVAAKWRVYLGGDTIGNFNIKRNCTYTYNITLNDAVTADTRVTLDLSKVTDLSAAGTANCYIVSQANTWYKFKATIRGNGAETAKEISPITNASNDLPTGETMNPTSSELVWETHGHKQIIQTTFFKDGYVFFKTGPSMEGNAVIAVKEKDNIVWSWHIWRTTFDLANMPTQIYKTKPKSINGFNTIRTRYMTMMDRHLGAYSSTASQTDDVIRTYGLYYLWGRKDPFPGPATREAKFVPGTTTMTLVYDANGNLINLRDAEHQVSSSSIGDGTYNITAFINYGIKHPVTYVTTTYDDYGTGKSSYSWIYGSYADLNIKTDGWRASNKLWGSDVINENDTNDFNFLDTKKTIYDPCPAGWCLPPADVWSNFTINNYTTTNPNEYNCTDKRNFATDGVWYLDANVFGREFYINEDNFQTAFYPAQGFREREDGTIYCIGNYIATWSSFPKHINANRGSCSTVLVCNTTIIQVTGVGWRADSFPVRCVKESDMDQR